MTFYPDRVSGARFEPTAGDSFLFSKDTGGDEFFQIYRYDFADGSVTLLTDGKSRNTGALWSATGEWIAYGSTRRTGDDVDIYVVEASNPKTERRVLELREEAGSSATGRPTTEAPRDRGDLDQRDLLWLADVASGTKTARRPKGKDKSPTARRVRAGRQGPVRHARRRLRVPAARLHGPGDEEDRVPDAGHRRRRGLRPLFRRQDARLRHQREGGQRPPPAGHGVPPRAPGPKLPLGVVSGLGGTGTAAPSGSRWTPRAPTDA